MNGGSPGGRNLSSLISVSLNPLWSGSLNFSGSLVCFGTYAKFVSFGETAKFVSSGKLVGSTITARGLAANQLSGGEEIIFCIVCFA